MLSKNKYIFFFVTIFLFSFFGSIYQATFVYDPFHWGLAQSSIDLLSNKEPYKDFFIHYGFVSILLKSLFLLFFDYNVISTFYLSSFCFSLANGLLCYLLFHKVKCESNIIFFLPVVIFSLHPFANHPWYNYEFYLFLVLYLFFFFSNFKYSFFISGFFLGTSCLIYENFLYASLVIIFYKLFIFKKKKILQFLISFLLPIIIFFLYLIINEIFYYWLKTFTLNKVFFEIYGVNIINLIKNFFFNFIFLGFSKALKEPYYLFFLIIFFINIIFFIKKNFDILILKKKISDNERFLLVISLVAILSAGSAIHNFNIFRLSTGLIVGLATLFYLYNYLNFKKKVEILLLASLILLLPNFIPIKKNNNKIFPTFSSFENVTSKKFNLFRSQQWPRETWEVLTKIESINFEISRNCQNISHFINFTDDAFIYLITSRYFQSNQYLYWLKNEKYYFFLMEHYNNSIYKLLSKKELDKNSIIISDLKEYYFIKKYINSKKFKLIELPYSFQTKNKIFLIPNDCYFKLKNDFEKN